MVLGARPHGQQRAWESWLACKVGWALKRNRVETCMTVFREGIAYGPYLQSKIMAADADGEGSSKGYE